MFFSLNLGHKKNYDHQLNQRLKKKKKKNPFPIGV
jgi:hypothetical protein